MYTYIYTVTVYMYLYIHHRLVRLWWQLVPLLLCLVQWFLLRFLLRFLLLLHLPTMEAEGARKKCAAIGQADATTTKC